MGKKFTQILLYPPTRWDTFGLEDKKKGLIPSKDANK